MIVACKSSIIAQELLLRKNKILEQMAPFLKSLRIKVKDIRFDCKKSFIFDEDENQ
jgi:predicted Holliday junction resolvase-like endonuclease